MLKDRFCLMAVACLIAVANPVVAATVDGAVAAPSLPGTSNDFSTVARQAIPAVVSIQVRSDSQDGDDLYDLFSDDLFQFFFRGMPKGGGRGSRERERSPNVGQASGFIISPDGYILTNNHVVKGATEITVVFNNGREFAGKVVGQDENTDVAVVKIDGNDLPFLKLGNSDDLEVGQWVVAIGNPLGLQASLTAGIVSAKDRNNLALADVEDFIQTDAAINRGNSGGPLVDLSGQVVGMNTAIVTNMGGGGYMGIGFAIPSNLLHSVKDQLINNGKVTRGYLGLTMQAVDYDLAQAFGLKNIEGALVADIIKGSPADKAGLKQGDVILRFNNQPVVNIGALRNAVAMTKPGTGLPLVVLRDGKYLNLNVDVGSFPKGGAVVVGPQTVDSLGLEVQNLTPELAGKFGYSESEGVIINKVDPSSPAAWAGLRKGALILAVNKQKVSNVDDYEKALQAHDKNLPTLFLIKQGGAVRYLSLKVN